MLSASDPTIKLLTVYGIGKDLSKDAWHHYAKELQHEGYLQQSQGEYPVLLLTEKSRNVLFKAEKVKLQAPVIQQIPVKEPVTIHPHTYEKELFENLKNYAIAWPKKRTCHPI